MSILVIRNRQRIAPVDARLLRRLTLSLLRDLLKQHDFELGIHLVSSPEMIRLNETFVRHKGSTDVITFDYGSGVPSRQSRDGSASPKQIPACNRPATGETELQTLYGEIFVCVDEAVSQARRFRTSWQSELARYVTHGLLHLAGFDDLRPAARRVMKRAEDRLLRQLARRFTLSRLARPRRRPKPANRKSPAPRSPREA